MAVTDYKFAGTVTESNIWSRNWSNPDYVKADDTSYASYNVASKETSETLYLSNFGFTSSDIPTGATINGIEFVVSRYSGTSDTQYDSVLQLLNVTTPTEMASATKWPTSIGEATYGGATNKCCSSVTQSQIVSSNFGVQIAVAGLATCYIDYIKIRVYYTEGGGTTVKPHYYYLQQ